MFESEEQEKQFVMEHGFGNEWAKRKVINGPTNTSPWKKVQQTDDDGETLEIIDEATIESSEGRTAAIQLLLSKAEDNNFTPEQRRRLAAERGTVRVVTKDLKLSGDGDEGEEQEVSLTPNERRAAIDLLLNREVGKRTDERQAQIDQLTNRRTNNVGRVPTHYKEGRFKTNMENPETGQFGYVNGIDQPEAGKVTKYIWDQISGYKIGKVTLIDGRLHSEEWYPVESKGRQPLKVVSGLGGEVSYLD